MSLKKVRGGVTGFGDTLVSKTCLFILGSHIRGGGEGRYIWYLVYSTVTLSLKCMANLKLRTLTLSWAATHYCSAVAIKNLI